MKKLLIFSILLSVFPVSLPAVTSPADSLRHVIARTSGSERTQAYKKLASIYIGEIRKEHVIDTLFTIYDAMEADARKAGDIAGQGVIRNNRIAALSNKRLYDELIRQAPDALSFLEANELWKDYYQTYSILIDAYLRKGDHEKALKEAEQVYEHAHKRNDRSGMGVLLSSLSRIYDSQRRFPEAEKCLRESIDMLQDQTLHLNLLATVCNRLATNLISQERYDEALQAAHQTELVNHRYEAASKSPQPSAWGNLYFTYIDIYRQTNEFHKAQLYVDKVDSLTKGSVKLYKERGHILYGLKRYPEAIEMLDKAIAARPQSLEAKALKLMALTQMREADKAVELFSDVIGELEAQHNAEYNAKLDEIHTQYEVDRHIAEKERNLHYFFFALGGCLLLAMLLAGVAYYNRIILAKNRSLYLKIKEQDRLEEELARLQAQEGGEKADRKDELLPGDRQQRELVIRLRKHLLSGNRLIDVDTNRDTIALAIGTNRNILSEAVRAVTGKTPMEYIRTLQLEEARRLLDKCPEQTIETIAYDCGFNAPSTFYRLFRKCHGISPAEYRKISLTFASPD